MLSATLPRLGNQPVLALLSVADRTGLGSRVSEVVLNEAIRRLRRTNGAYPPSDQLCLQLLEREGLTAKQMARALAAIGNVALRSESAAGDAVEYFARAISFEPQRTAWRVDMLRAAAAAGDRLAFYSHLTPQIARSLGRAKLARLIGRLGKTCRAAREWRAAADAFDHARTLQPNNETWQDKLDLVRHQAPEWGFYSADPSRRWRLDAYPDAATTGIVAPITSHFVTGWIPASFDEAHIEFKLNGVTVADARADLLITLPDGNEYRLFSRMLKDIWNYSGAGDVLTIECTDSALPIIDHGLQFHFVADQSRSGELLEKINADFVINKYGLLRPSILGNHGWQANVFDLYASLRHDLAEGLGLDVFPFYGTMLGAVREQNFISHDNDFDTVYISTQTEPERVRKEFKEVCEFLISRGYSLSAKKSHTWVMRPGRKAKLDLFYSWFNSDGFFEVSYAYHGHQLRQSPDFFKFRTEKLGDFEIPVPTNAEQILEQLYGEGWRYPDPGFSHQRVTRVLDRRSLLTTDDQTEIYWDEFYRDHASARPSRFAEFVQTRFPNPGVLVEFGCGDGIDAIHFATQGWTALCCDRSPQAIVRAQNTMPDAAAKSARFETVDVGDMAAVQEFITRNLQPTAAKDPLVVYLRFFLHAITESAQDGLLDALTRTIDLNFYLCAEFRTLEDRHLAKVHADHYRRYINHHSLAEKLGARWGFDVQYLAAGQGFSPHAGEDPHLCRVVAFHRRHRQSGSVVGFNSTGKSEPRLPE